MEIDDPRDPSMAVLELFGLVPERAELRTEDADRDGVAGAGQHLADPLLEIRLHVALQSGVAVDDLLDVGDGVLVVDGGIDADPVFAEVHADDLVGGERLADVRTEVSDARDLPQLLAGPLW